jgi:hypothetical protein
MAQKISNPEQNETKQLTSKMHNKKPGTSKAKSQKKTKRERLLCSNKSQMHAHIRPKTGST